ncbi:MAG: UDP-N-acetylmuramoylalanine--D-glutamate ligase [Actinobacteria bacterium 13_2_20CM_68_14]|nr:MAG: UDP-N-acetylmuramoylalanine--D-glutamate ligase [Actinobacteria bacterium 13_2_20CM_68_14]OLE18385.1 MAG: UDP-N-acetylmuramoylalanine--D-glutamate ligase [Actinobacteria bacterium 13_1_20CM_4_68_12]
MNELPERVLVLGLARSGLAAAAALERRGVEVVRADRELGNDEDVGLVEGVGLLVKSPGVPAEASLVAGARERGVPVWSEIELGSRLLPNPILGVTGTNGKTTTAEWLGFMLGAPVAGNVGRALSELDGEVEPEQLVVVELSSFQLEDIDRFRPRIAVLLNLEPDHLDRHGSFKAYRDAKLRIFENQTEADTAVVPRDLDHELRAQRVEFAADDRLPAEPSLRGAHNRENAAAAVAAARAAGAREEEIVRGLRDFRGVPHRLELVAERGGVGYVNDSKATNVAATLRALAAYEDEPVRLILGGSRKGEDFAPLAAALGPNVRAVYVIGETADELARVIPDTIRAGDLATAVERAATAAQPGEVVLLSPACASYDQFGDFEERGEEFKRLVANLPM